MRQLLRDLRSYQRASLPGDIAAAVTVWAIVVPEGVAYAGIAGVPPEIGLYVATVPLIVYALIGSSRRMTVGPSATSAAVSAAAIAPLAMDAESFVELTVALTMIVGVVLALAAVAKLGILAEFLSEPVLKGFITGVAITIAGGQLGHGATIVVGLICLAALMRTSPIHPLIAGREDRFGLVGRPTRQLIPSGPGPPARHQRRWSRLGRVPVAGP